MSRITQSELEEHVAGGRMYVFLYCTSRLPKTWEFLVTFLFFSFSFFCSFSHVFFFSCQILFIYSLNKTPEISNKQTNTHTHAHTHMHTHTDTHTHTHTQVRNLINVVHVISVLRQWVIWTYTWRLIEGKSHIHVKFVKSLFQAITN